MPVYESHKPNDIKFVAKAIRDNGLTPWPVKGYYRDFPLQWSNNHKTRHVQLEHYEWGTVIFANNESEPRWASTLVCVGEIDWEAGTVTAAAEVAPIPIPWIFAIRFEQGERAMATSDESIPECVGYHDHCPTCDGGQNTVTGTVEVACPWRIRCYCLKLYLLENNLKPDAFLDSVPNPVELQTRLAEIERERVDRVPPPAAEAATLGRGTARGSLTQQKPAARKRRKKGRSHNPLGFKPLEPLVRAFLKRLEEKICALGYGWAKSRASALSGQCYVHRETEKSNFLIVYVASERGRYAKLAIVRYKTSYRCIDIAFTAEFEKALGVPGTKLRKLVANRLGMAEWHGIRDKKTARIAARRIVRMVHRKLIKLPAPRTAT